MDDNDGQMIFGDLGGLKLPDNCLTDEEKLRKKERLENALILQPFCRFTYVTAHSPTLPLLHQRHNSFSNPAELILQISVASPTSQLILQPFRRFTYITAHSPIPPLLHLRHSSFSNHSFASPTSQALHLTSPREPPMFQTRRTDLKSINK